MEFGLKWGPSDNHTQPRTNPHPQGGLKLIGRPKGTSSLKGGLPYSSHPQTLPPRTPDKLNLNCSYINQNSEWSRTSTYSSSENSKMVLLVGWEWDNELFSLLVDKSMLKDSEVMTFININ